MYIYCIAPSGNIICNFIKVGICKDNKSLRKRYSTYYGTNLIYYYIKVKLKILEKDLHNELKNMKLHIENELFKYNDKYNFDFYKKKLNEFFESHKRLNKDYNYIFDNIVPDINKLFIYCENPIIEKKKLKQNIKEIENIKDNIIINHKKYCTTFYNYIIENINDILICKKEFEKKIEILTINNINDDDINKIIEYKIKKENINQKNKMYRLKNKFTRCFYLYKNYKDTIKNIEFGAKILVEMSNNRWNYFKKQLETKIKLQTK